jgi:hypothetical protein
LWWFNKLTSNLPPYFIVCVKITIFDNRSFLFIVDSFSITFALNILKFKKIKKVKILHSDKFNDKEFLCIKLKDVLHYVYINFLILI